MANYRSRNDFPAFMEECGALLFGEFTLKSGRNSPYFVNTGKYNCGSYISRLGEFYADLIIDSGINFDVLYGPAYKGIPLATITAAKLADANTEVHYAFNRKEEKDHGDGGSIMGFTPTKQSKIAIIEDVTTAGTSIRETLELFEQIGITNPVENIKALYISVDRMERGTGDISATEQIEKEYGIPVFSIVNTREIIAYLEREGRNGEAVKMTEYLAQYGV